MGSRYRRRGGTESQLETIVFIIPGVKSSEAGAGSQDHSEGGLWKDFGHRDNPGSSLEEKLKEDKIKQGWEKMETSQSRNKENMTQVYGIKDGTKTLDQK